METVHATAADPLTATSADGLVESVEPDVPRLAFVGVRACELAALDIQERVLRAGRRVTPTTPRDVTRRSSLRSKCAVAMSTCFCTSMGTGPEVTDGADLVLSELDDGFAVRSLTPAGEKIVGSLGLQAATSDQARASADQVAAVRAWIGDPVATDGLPERLRAVDHPQWQEVAEALSGLHELHPCLPDLLLHERQRRLRPRRVYGHVRADVGQYFTLGFGRVAGDANFRPRVADRYRQWLTHKFSTWWDQFGSTGCVGCGRCITWCPVGIDVREELLAIAPPDAAPAPILAARPASGPRSDAAEHDRTCTLRRRGRVGRPSRDRRYGHALADDGRSFTPGQPSGTVRDGRPARSGRTTVSISRSVSMGSTSRSGTSARRPPPTARHRAIASRCVDRSADPGRSRRHGGDVVIVAGGIGLAPLRPVIEEVLRDPPSVLGRSASTSGPARHMTLRGRDGGARWSYRPRARRDRRPGWAGLARPGRRRHPTFERASWRGDRTTAFVCGPDRMMQATARALAGRGVAAPRTLAAPLSGCGLRRRPVWAWMGPYFVCRDGPVFSVAELGDTFTVEGR